MDPVIVDIMIVRELPNADGSRIKIIKSDKDRVNIPVNLKFHLSPTGRDLESVEIIKPLFSLPPDQCAWCNSKDIVGKRQEKLEISLAKIFTMYFTNFLTTARSGLSSKMSTKDAVSISFDIQVPHCQAHSSDNINKALKSELIDTAYSAQNGQFGVICSIKVQSAEFAKAIASPYYKRFLERDDETHTLRLPFLTDLVWPDRCIACGATGNNKLDKVKVHVQTEVGQTPVRNEESVNVPFCPEHLKEYKGQGIFKFFMSKTPPVHISREIDYTLRFDNQSVAEAVWEKVKELP